MCTTKCENEPIAPLIKVLHPQQYILYIIHFKSNNANLPPKVYSSAKKICVHLIKVVLLQNEDKSIFINE